MASPSSFFFLCALLVFIVSPSLSLSSSDKFPKNGYISLPVNMDPSTHQYYTSIGVGTPQHKMKLAIDISENFMWYECGKHYNSSSYNPVLCDSPICPGEWASSCESCDGLPLKPGCTNFTCSLAIHNPFANFGYGGDLGHDFIYTPQVKLPSNFISACVETSRMPDFNAFVGLPKGTKGVLGLARQKPLTLPSQISSYFNVIPKFSFCLPSSPSSQGQLYIGGGPSFSNPLSQTGFGGYYSNYDYFFHLNSINIDHKPVYLNTSGLFVDQNGNLGTQISTIQPFSVLHPQLYQPFVKAFSTAAKANNMKRVDKVKPYPACYDANTVGDHREAVPTIDLVIEGGRFGNVNYEISGHDSLVEVEKGVLCIAFVNGGISAIQSVILGAHQLKDRIFEFDASTSTISFSSSLKSCPESDHASL